MILHTSFSNAYLSFIIKFTQRLIRGGDRIGSSLFGERLRNIIVGGDSQDRGRTNIGCHFFSDLFTTLECGRAYAGQLVNVFKRRCYHKKKLRRK